MHFDKRFLIVLIVFFFISIAAVSANDLNSTESIEMDCNGTSSIGEVDSGVDDLAEGNATGNDSASVEKTTPKITVESKTVYSKDTLLVHLKNSTGGVLKHKKLTAQIGGKSYYLTTDSQGVAKLKINLDAKKYKLTISFDGDEDYNSISKKFNIKVIKLKTRITESANFVVRGKYLYFHLTDIHGDRVSGKKITLKYKGKTYNKKTNRYGTVKIKINAQKSRYPIKAKFKTDNQYVGSSKYLKFYVTSSRSINIANTKLLSNGYIRVYLKVAGKAVSKKVKLTIGGKKISKKANSEGIVVIKPAVKAGHYVVKANVGKYYSKRDLKCFEGNVRDPLKESIPLKGGVPDVDLMPGNYVLGDENGKYTLTKSQYKEVLKRDSHCLFLNSKLTKYTFFKTKNHPKLNHIIKREKWNVIEREIITKLVKKNKKDYWPGKVTVSLKGKSYIYPEVRDVQATSYTCGPASASMCTQVLKNYMCESHISHLADSKRGEGTSCGDMINALQKNNFICKYFYKSTFKNALDELKNGGAALIFHANYHYVSILDISSDGKKVLVSNSYGTYDGIPTKWVSVSFMKKKFSPKWDESLIVKLNYDLSDSTKNSVNSYYHSFGTNWHKHSTSQKIGRI